MTSVIFGALTSVGSNRLHLRHSGIASGSMMTGITGNSGNNSAGQIITNNSMGSPFDNILNGGDWNSVGGNGINTMNPAPNQDPLSNLMDSVNSLDPLNSMGKSLNEQVRSCC